MSVRKSSPKTVSLPKVRSIMELKNLAAGDERFKKLATIAARNLGADSDVDLSGAIKWLETNALETSEDGVVGEINFCRDLVVVP